MFSLSQYAVPSLQGGHGFSLLCTMCAKNMSTVFTEPSLGASSVSIERKDGSRLHHMLFCCQGAFFLRAIDYSTTVLHTGTRYVLTIEPKGLGQRFKDLKKGEEGDRQMSSI